nr:MAG TPA: hypothetical protein [Caudoviricetes sp.]
MIPAHAEGKVPGDRREPRVGRRPTPVVRGKAYFDIFPCYIGSYKQKNH